MKWDDLLFRGLKQAAREWQRSQDRLRAAELRRQREQRQLELRQSQREARAATDSARRQLRVSMDREVGGLSDVEFEAYVAGLFEHQGWRATLTKRSGDQGIDIELVKVADGRRAIAQCKKWKGNVGQPVVRDLYGTMLHANADEAYVVTPGGFTPSATAFSLGKPIRLIGGSELLQWTESCRSKKLAAPPPTSPTAAGAARETSTGAPESPGARPVGRREDEDLPTPEFIGYCREMSGLLQELSGAIENAKREVGGAQDHDGKCISGGAELRDWGEGFLTRLSQRVKQTTGTLLTGFSKCNAEFDATRVRSNLAGFGNAVRELGLLGADAYKVTTTDTCLRPAVAALQRACPAALDDLADMVARIEAPFRQFLESPNTAIQRGVVQPSPSGGYRFAGNYNFTLPRFTSELEQVRATLSLAVSSSGGAVGSGSGCFLVAILPWAFVIAALVAWARA